METSTESRLNETSWGFQKSPILKTGEDLNESFQNWQKRIKNDFFHLHSNEENLNHIFTSIYGLVDELISKVKLKDISILQEELDRKVLSDIAIHEPDSFKSLVDQAQAALDKAA